MTIDLEDRLRRAATVLDDHIAGHASSAEYVEAPSGRRRLAIVGIAAAALIALGAASFAVLVSRDEVQTVPAIGTTDPSALASSVPNPEEGWAVLPDAPIAPRGGHLAVSTGSGLFVWGGYDGSSTFADGAYYDVTTRTWHTLPEGPLTGLSHVIGVWTGHEVVVVFEPRDQVKAAAFDPVAFTWRDLPDPPLVSAVASMNRVLMWNGNVVVVEAVEDDSGGTTNAVARLDLSNEQWVTAAESIPPFGMDFEAVAAGEEIFVVADGRNGSPCGQTIVAYDPGGDSWREVTAALPERLVDPVVVWTGTELFVGGGYECGTNAAPPNTAALLDPATGNWRAAVPAPIGIQSNPDGTEVWTGQSVLVVTANDVPLLYNAAADAWHVGPAGPLGVTTRALYSNSWSWVDGRLILFSGSTENATAAGSFIGDPVDGAEAYTPPPGF